MAQNKVKLVSEVVGGEPYQYYPLGEHVVRAPGVCDGQPTFKYTRISVHHALELLSGGRTVEEVARAYQVPLAAVQEALALASRALRQQKVARVVGEQAAYDEANGSQTYVLPLP